MKNRQTSIEHKISLAAAYIDYRFPEHAPVTILANGQGENLNRNRLSDIYSHSRGEMGYANSLCFMAASCLFRQGVYVSSEHHDGYTYTLHGRADELSELEKLAVIALFAGVRKKADYSE